jgi:hypothetical protein
VGPLCHPWAIISGGPSSDTPERGAKLGDGRLPGGCWPRPIDCTLVAAVARRRVAPRSGERSYEIWAEAMHATQEIAQR